MRFKLEQINKIQPRPIFMKKYFIALFVLLGSVFFVFKAEASTIYNQMNQDSYIQYINYSGWGGSQQLLFNSLEGLSSSTQAVINVQFDYKPVPSECSSYLESNVHVLLQKPDNSKYIGFSDFPELALDQWQHVNINTIWPDDSGYSPFDISAGEEWEFRISKNCGGSKFQIKTNNETIKQFFGSITFSVQPLKPITLIYPVPTMSQVVNIDKPISLYTLFTNGTCKINGEDRIFVRAGPSSYVPTSTDFTTQGIDCINYEWSTSLSNLSLGLNDLNFWARDFLDSSSTPIYNYDYIDSQVYLDQIMSFNPSYFSTSTVPTSTLNSLWLDLGSTTLFSRIPLIGHYLQDIWDHIKSRFPWGYLDEIWSLWRDATPSNAYSYSLWFDITPEMGAPATTTLALPIISNMDSSSPWNGSIYSSKFNSYEAKLTPWIWFGWGLFYLNVIISIFRKKINFDRESEE